MVSLLVSNNIKTMEYKHFSHEHNLTLYNVQPNQQLQCHGCNQPCNGSILSCWNCNFFLHEHCGNANRYVKHPSHSPHPLVLLPTPTYCSGAFLCNGCGAPGSTFSYCCPLCEIDLHVHCAYLPPKFKHHSHQHHMYLSFDQTGNKGSCKICSKELSSKNWVYFCAETECDFRVHTFCVTSEVKPGLYQHDEPDEEIRNPIIPASNSCMNGYHRKVDEPTLEELVDEMHRQRLEMVSQSINRMGAI